MKNVIKLAGRVAAVVVMSLSLAPVAWTQMTGDVPETRAEKANQKVVTDFWREVLAAQNPAAASKYYAPDIIQHNPNVPSGLQGFQEFFGRFWKSPKPVQPVITPAPAVLLTKGDLTLIVQKHTQTDPTDSSKTYDSYWFDLFRVRDGKIVEHWDNAMKMPPRSAH